jgi:hypothetical protein
LAVALALTLAISAAALAAGPLRGKTYEGQTASTGADSEGHQLRLHPGASPVSLSVSSNGRSVTVRFPSHSPLLYCRTTEQLQVQSTKSATISGGGSFRATVSQRFSAGPGASAITQIITGQFSGRTVRGTIHTAAAECSGTTSFSATVR